MALMLFYVAFVNKIKGGGGGGGGLKGGTFPLRTTSFQIGPIFYHNMLVP